MVAFVVLTIKLFAYLLDDKWLTVYYYMYIRFVENIEEYIVFCIVYCVNTPIIFSSNVMLCIHIL